MDRRIKNIVIVGGGTAGWMTAAALARLFEKVPCNIRLVESEEIGTVGVGESTIPSLRTFNQFLGLDEAEFVKATQATFKLAIEFVNWRHIGHLYYHPFGPYGIDIRGVSFPSCWLKFSGMGGSAELDDYNLQALAARNEKFALTGDIGNSPMSEVSHAYHFDAFLYAQYLRRYAEQRSVRRVEGKIVDVERDPQSGFIRAVVLAGGERIEGEFFVDCSGFRGLLIEQTLQTGFDDWSHWLPCDRAITVPSAAGGDLRPVTRATAREAGWQWRIPLQHRIGNGYVYSSAHIGADEATGVLLANLDGEALAEPWLLKFKAGRRRKAWNGNCVAIGLSAGFMEPLESQSIYLIQTGITQLIRNFPDLDFEPSDIDCYNRIMTWQFERIRDFLILHYSATERNDTPFWNYTRTMSLPDWLTEKIELFRARGRIFRENSELFAEASWFAVLYNQGIIPRRYDPVVDAVPDDELKNVMHYIRAEVARAVARMPTHSAYIARRYAAERPEQRWQTSSGTAREETEGTSA